jgi:hypothetical protein
MQKEHNVVRLADWPQIPQHAPVGTPAEAAENDIGAALREMLDRARKDGYVPHERTIHIRNFRSDKYALRDDLVITLEEHGDDFVARCYDLGQYGCGISSDAAIADLCSVLEEYYEILREDRGKLSKRLAGHLSYLDTILGGRL